MHFENILHASPQKVHGKGPLILSFYPGHLKEIVISTAYES
jgi:hypothetical protein